MGGESCRWVDMVMENDVENHLTHRVAGVRAGSRALQGHGCGCCTDAGCSPVRPRRRPQNSAAMRVGVIPTVHAARAMAGPSAPRSRSPDAAAAKAVAGGGRDRPPLWAERHSVLFFVGLWDVLKREGDF